jgi:hypothetical protein
MKKLINISDSVKGRLDCQAKVIGVSTAKMIQDTMEIVGHNCATENSEANDYEIALQIYEYYSVFTVNRFEITHRIDKDLHEFCTMTNEFTPFKTFTVCDYCNGFETKVNLEGRNVKDNEMEYKGYLELYFRGNELKVLKEFNSGDYFKLMAEIYTYISNNSE